MQSLFWSPLKAAGSMLEGSSHSPHVAILFALAEEQAPFERQVARNARLLQPKKAGTAASVGTRTISSLPEFSLACSGMGIRNAAAAAEELLKSGSPSLLIVCGFGGGLTPGLTPGSVFVANSVKNLCGADIGFRGHSIADSALVSRAGSVRLSGGAVVRGPLVTVDRVLTQVHEKRDLTETGAHAVDMESAGAVRVAERCGIPWLAVRAITDGAAEELPFDFNAMAGADGVVDRRRVALAAVTHPWKIPALIRLGQRSSLAGLNLADFLVAFLEQMPQAL